jgi:flap endonuclease-1
MGVALKDLFVGKEIEISDLKNKVLAVDSYNLLYQFLTTIRGRDGSLLMDSKGNVTSHLVGLFSRTTNLMQQGLKLVFVFDGKSPKLKEKERERRKMLKLDAEKAYKKAVQREDLDDMKKYAARMTRLTPDLVEEAKKVIEALGLPVVDAPSEGEAQAAYMAKKEDAFAIVSQDFDSLIHGAPLLVRNLSIAGKRKKSNKLSYEIIKPEQINLSDSLNKLGIDQEQLIVLALLVGTDYNLGGVKGIGPKKALETVQKYGKDFDNLFKDVKWGFEFPWAEVYYLIKKMPVTDDYSLKWAEINKEKLIKLLVDRHDFSEERVSNTIHRIVEEKETKQQKGLKDFF